MPGLSQLAATPSPGSSSTSTNSGSGSGKSITNTSSRCFPLQMKIIQTILHFAGTDTVKRGISPATSLSASLSNTKLKESESNYSIKTSSYAPNENHKSTFSYERGANKTSNGPKSVIFAPDVGTALLSSSSSYSISEQLKINPTVGLNPSTTSTSQLIKQTLSPLTQHRNFQPKQSSPNPTSAADLTNSPLKIQTNHTPALGAYQFTSSSLNTTNTNSSKPPPHHHHQSSALNDNNTITSSIHKSSPSRTLGNNNHTSTLPSNIARNMLYQSESSYSLKNQQQNNFTSPGNAIGAGAGVGNVSQANNIYGTLPKSSSPFSGNGGGGGNSNSNSSTNTNTAAIYGNVSSVANEFEQIIARNASNASAAHSNAIGAGNYNTLGSYRVQYSSTNPFLPSFNPHSTEMNAASNHDDK